MTDGGFSEISSCVLQIEGVVGITLDDSDVFVVHINEVHQGLRVSDSFWQIFSRRLVDLVVAVQIEAILPNHNRRAGDAAEHHEYE